jgi:hypothetical protein
LGIQNFLLGLQQLLEIEDTENSTSVQRAYIDNTFAHVTTKQLLITIRYFLSNGPKIGIILKREKLNILLGKFSDDNEAAALHNLLTDPHGEFRFDAARIRLHPSNGGDAQKYGMVLLGSPIGSTELIINYLQNKISEVKHECDRLIQLENPQTKFLLLYYCFSRKINHLLRSISPALAIEHLVNPFNNILKKSYRINYIRTARGQAVETVLSTNK